MNLKIAFPALAGLMAIAKAMSHETYDLVRESNVANANVQPRHLQQCDISGKIECKLNRNGSDCQTINIRKDTCRQEVVTMYYTYCNNDNEQIVFDQAETYAELYEGGKISIGQEVPLQPRQCRTIEQTGIVDTCTRSRVNADLELEGRKGTALDGDGAYCWKYIHYFPEIKKYTLAPLPSPVFKWKLVLNSLACRIAGTNESCADYISRIPALTSEFCVKDLEYDFKIRNVGNACREVTSVSTSINGNAGTNIIASNVNFCPSNTIPLTDRRNDVNICDLQNQEIPFQVSVNGQTGSAGLDSISFPEANNLAPIDIDFTILSLVCEVKVNDALMSCADYIDAKNEQSLPCQVNPIFKSVIKNTEGSPSSCIDIADIDLAIDGPIGTSTIDVSSWSTSRKTFCSSNELSLKKKFHNIDLCSYAGQSVDYVVTLNQRAALTRGTDISFPELNSVSGSSAPSAVPSPVPLPAAQQCYSKPESITFGFTQKTCEESSNSQVDRKRKLRRKLDRGHQGKGGKGYKNKGQCRASCNDKCSFEQLKENPKIYVYERTKYGRQELYSETYSGGAITFLPDEMPDCIEIEIRDSTKKYQTVSFDVTCSNYAELSVGDTFGAITILGFNAC